MENKFSIINLIISISFYDCSSKAFNFLFFFGIHKPAINDEAFTVAEYNRSVMMKTIPLSRGRNYAFNITCKNYLSAVRVCDNFFYFF